MTIHNSIYTQPKQTTETRGGGRRQGGAENMGDLLFREERKKRYTLSFDLLKEPTENFRRRRRGRSLYGADGPKIIIQERCRNHHWKVWYRRGIWRLRVSEVERDTAEMPTAADSKAKCAANSRPATRQNLRQQGGTGEDGHIYLADYSQCSGDREDEEGGT